jgi:hypothetical protein
MLAPAAIVESCRNERRLHHRIAVTRPQQPALQEFSHSLISIAGHHGACSNRWGIIAANEGCVVVLQCTVHINLHTKN